MKRKVQCLKQEYDYTLHAPEVNSTDFGEMTVKPVLLMTDNGNPLFYSIQYKPVMIAENGFPVEIHEVQTADGYILTLHRIPGTKAQGYDNKLLPVFLQHGLMDSSAGWILRGPNDALAYLLAKRGYDVWLGNFRGNVYSRRHANLKPEDDQFWDFSWHELGLYDVPASIDYVLRTTGKNKLNYVGHSMGTTSFFVMASMRPDYNQKINQMIALAPVAYMSHTRSPIHIIARHSRNVQHLLDSLGHAEFLPRNKELTHSMRLACEALTVQKKLCEHAIFLFAGHDEEQFVQELLPVIVGHNPAGASTKSFIHYAQEVESSKFRQFDYGPIKNMVKYKSLSPPDYDVSQITAPVSLHYADNDLLAQPADVLRLYRELPNKAGLYRMNVRKFNHMDFLWGRDVKTLVNDRIIEILSQN